MQKFECTEICKKVAGRTILNNVTITAKQGEVIALLGPNGAGKTTCFSILCGLIKPDSGAIKLDDKDITDYPMYKRARMGIGYLPQEASTFRGLTVEENIRVVLENRKSKDTEKTLSRLLDDFSLTHVKKTKAVLLSGGERRKLEIARALANEPKYIMLDEPFAGIDPIAISDMRKTIIDLKNRNIGVIITDHNVRDTLPVVDNAYILAEGKILAQGNIDEITKNEAVLNTYLGKNFVSG